MLSKHALKAAAVSPWLAQDQAYQRHHMACPVCIAAGKGQGQRCAVGAALWVAYAEAEAEGVSHAA